MTRRRHHVENHQPTTEPSVLFGGGSLSFFFYQSVRGAVAGGRGAASGSDLGATADRPAGPTRRVAVSHGSEVSFFGKKIARPKVTGTPRTQVIVITREMTWSTNLALKILADNWKKTNMLI